MPCRDGMQIATRRNKPLHGSKLPWIGSGYPVRTPGKEKQASSVAGYGNQPRPKKPASSLLQAASPAEYGVHRSPPAADRCSGLDDDDTFNVGPPQGITAAIPVHPWRPSSLLSGCPPTDTRPQARAKLGKAGNRNNGRHMQEKFSPGPKFFRAAKSENSRGWQRSYAEEPLARHPRPPFAD